MSAILVTTPLPRPGMTLLTADPDIHVDVRPMSPPELADACASGNYSVVVAQLRDRFDAELLSEARLTGISNYAVGCDNIDVSAATAQGIVVANTPGVLTDATADIALLLILATARRAVEADTYVRAGRFRGWEPELLLGSDVSGSVLGLAGFGRIARATAERALGFGMTVNFCPRPPGDRPVTDEELGSLADRVHHVGWDDLVADSDFLSLHVPLTPATHHLVDANVLRAMKPSAILINTARGPVVDEAALVVALRDGDITAAGLDVYEAEPDLAPGLAQADNAVLLPHLGSATVKVRAKMATLCAENAVAMANGVLPPHPVNSEAWSHGVGEMTDADVLGRPSTALP
ncbi:D-glycerate dehydrogenase [Rhodococcus sp. Leaf7]|uniref:2-hydroxyacid dehydrogenase n=1 Tax=unclassified Rhodococcus (in: high G+C Gram-positive bacteria) TaxID=192944 RepID=UPI0006FE3FED|nr:MULTISPECIES: D-glycerate dehydrogenase [unclassified Rhodococcus (in: high G+C Gram-positive bacteria)]KQU01790.1 D-glycerate dehydrogenase [Rhodococcus sp. Leaf7]KQU36762.1 D-glycerate dehydrogenase [Rhodococcus sp. Leaf247]